MEAEFTKLRSSPLNVTFKDWLDQTYLSYGSLLAHSCQSALLLVGHKQSYQDAAFEFGKNLAVTRQVKCLNTIIKYGDFGNKSVINR